MFSFSIKANAQITPTPPTQSDSLFAFPQNYDNDVVYPIDSSGKVDKATSISCGYSSAAYINRYSNLNSYIPTANTPIIYINVAIHVFQDASGNNNWPNNTTTLTAFNQIMAWLNGDHSNNPTADPITANNSIPGDYISDSHIRYVLTGVYFYKNDYLNNGSGSAYFNSLYSYVQTNNPSSLTSLPIFITKGVYGNASGFTQMPPPASSSGLTNPVGIVLFHYYNTPSGEYAFYLTLNHELGHCLGLLHTYYNSCCPENNCVGSTDFMSDLWNPTCYATSPSCYAYEAGSWSCTPPSSPYNAVCTNNGAGNTNALTSCSNNIMGGTQAAGHISAMQMGKMHRTLALQSTRQYVQEMNSSHTQWIVNSDETWDFDMEMYQDIFVTNGATLTIKCKVEMADLGRIIVDRGSRLIINGGTVTATWKMWNGIELWGTSTQNQTVGNNGLSPYQGIVSIINGGTVTNAHNGITTIKDVAGNGSSSDWDWAYTGGIIQCDGAIFQDNWRAIQYLAYHNHNLAGKTIPNFGYIRRSTFVTDKNLNDASFNGPSDFITLYGVDGIPFLGNSYSNTISPLPPVDQRGSGIGSIDASYYVDKYFICNCIYASSEGCPPSCVVANVSSTFQNLYYGVYAQGITPVKNIAITDNNFVNCNRAIYFGGISYGTVASNNINVSNDSRGESSTIYPYGIYLDASTSYNVGQNIIYSTYTGGNAYNDGNYTAGIEVNGSGNLASTNLLYLNNMDNLGIGSIVYGNNSGSSYGQGLHYRCNNLGQTTVNGYDLYMAFDQNNIDGKISPYQGNGFNQGGADNTFSQNCLAPNNDFSDINYSLTYAQGGLVNYYYNPGAATLPTCIDPNMSTYPSSGAYSASVSCSPSVSPAISTSALMALINSTGNQVNALENMIDGGNTKKLLNDIASITNNGQLRKELMDYSPYLSDSVLLEYLRRNKTPAGNIKDVIIANSPVKPFVNEVIDSLTLPLGILVQIHLAQHGIAPIDTLQSRIASLNSNISLITDNQVRELLSDTADAWANDSLLILLSHDKRQESSDMLLASFVNFRMYAQADSLANQLKLNGEQNTFAEVQQIANQLNQTQEQAFSLLSNKSQQAQISEISKQYTQQGYINAKALLNLVVENYAQHTEWVTFPNKNSRRAIKKIVAKRDSLQASSLKVYPNPFGESLITVVYQLPSKAVRANLAITDITGRLLQSLELPTSATTTHIDLGKLPAGIYIAILNADGNIVGRTKLIKQ